MKKRGLFLTGLFHSGLLILFAACGKTDSSPGSGRSENAVRVFLPGDLLTASDSSEPGGFVVSTDNGSLSRHLQLRMMARTSNHEFNEMNTTHSLGQIEEDGSKSAGQISKGHTVRRSFETEMDLIRTQL